MKARLLLLWAGLPLLCGITHAAAYNPDTDWFKNARYGVFMHFLPGDAKGLALLKDFDVEALAGQLEDVGAKYFVITLGQNSGYMNSPNAAYEQRTGYAPGERCSTRDLPLDLNRALQPKGIRLMLYLPCQVPNGDARAQKAFSLPQGAKDQPIDLAFAEKWSEVIQEWSDRYGDKVSGWWFDGGYAHIQFNDAIADRYTAAVKHGNPKAIVTFNPGVKVIRWTKVEDYTAGELNEPLQVIPTGRWLEGSQWHALSYVGENWGRRNTRFRDEQWADWARKVTAHQGVFTLDMGPNYDATKGTVGSLAEPQVKQVKAIRAALRPETKAGGATLYPPIHFPDGSGWGRNIQRTMRLLATSTPEKRNTVRILFYGQSITEQNWAKLVENDLRRRFPHANLLIENRALGGFASQMLVKTAETDLYPFQPDLLIFHVYGAHDKYEDIIRRTRERTTAEILMQNDHVTKPADFTEETDPAKLPPAGKHWDAFMNHNWLPSLAKKYGCELCDQRALWKAYLAENKLEPKALLRDGVHLNPHGEWFMAQCVNAFLRYDPRLGPSSAEDCVKTYQVGKDVRWMDGKLRLDFDGNRVDVICRSGQAAPAVVRIDGRKPFEWPELYGFTRAVTQPEGKWPVKWPVIAPIGSQQPLLVEDWSLVVVKDPPSENRFTFALTGSKTGADGEGRSDARFVSNSGRIVLETNDWNVVYAFRLAGITPVPEAFTVKWKVEPRFVDEFVSPGVNDPTIEATVTLAQGLPNTRHTLEISGSDLTPIAALRVYRPPFRSK